MNDLVSRPRPWYRLHGLTVVLMLGVAATLVCGNAGVHKEMRSGTGTFAISNKDFEKYFRENPVYGPEFKMPTGGGMTFHDHNSQKFVYLSDVCFGPSQVSFNWSWRAEHREWGFPKPFYVEDDYSAEKVAEGFKKVFQDETGVDPLSDDFVAVKHWDLVGLSMNLVFLISVVGLTGLLAERTIRWVLTRIFAGRVQAIAASPDETLDGEPHSPGWDEAKNR